METGESQWEAPDELQTQGLEQGDKGVKTFGEEKKKKKKVVVRAWVSLGCCAVVPRVCAPSRHGHAHQQACLVSPCSKRTAPRATSARSIV